MAICIANQDSVYGFLVHFLVCKNLAVHSRVARFFLLRDTKTVKNVPNQHKMFQNGHKIFQH
jgi:hypothetical protein